MTNMSKIKQRQLGKGGHGQLLFGGDLRTE